LTRGTTTRGKGADVVGRGVKISSDGGFSNRTENKNHTSKTTRPTRKGTRL